MIGEIPIVSFDTSAHNRLVKDGSLAEPVLAGLKSGLSFRFVGMSLKKWVRLRTLPSEMLSLLTAPEYKTA
jgi:hypothetical protein